MLRINSISLTQFKNYTNRSFEFDQRIVAICGRNGIGKTNILDSIYYLCFTKSYFSGSDAMNVQQGARGFRIQGSVTLEGNNENAVCIVRENGKKEFSVNDEYYTRFSQHIGRYPCVVIAPDDAVLITGGSEERRRFLDELLSQLDQDYLKNLITYNKVLQQRNSFLKAAAENGHLDEALLSVLDEQLIYPGNYIFEKRRDFLISFLPKVKRLYNEIARQEEDLSVLYESRLLETPFEELLAATRAKDKVLQRSSAGIHRDDLQMQLGTQLFKNIASQGQRKSLLFALKLTEFETIKAVKRFSPLLLLDDVFEKLDEERINSLLQKVCTGDEEQIFITDTSEERLTNHMDLLKVPYQLIKL